MVAAIYARKSTEQNGIADEQKSVARQIEHARAYAVRKGWTVAEQHVYADDGISGAEFANRPGFLRLMNALKPRPAFNVLVMSEDSRLGREAIETSYALKQIITAGVRVFFYLEDRERTLDSPTDKLMLSVTAFADELEREKARQRTYDAMQRKARAGHVTGGRVFGYDNVDVMVADGNGEERRSHVTRQINEAEANVVRRIFQLCADGWGKTRIAKQLNAEGAVSPRAQQGRPRAWAPSSVHEALYRDLYRGEVIWNRSKKRDQWGQKRQAVRPEEDWLRMPMPELRIVPEDLWRAAHARLDDVRGKYLRATGGKLWGRSRDVESKYLLTSFVRCGVCGGSLYVKSRSHGRQRAFYYGCMSFHKRGASVCTNNVEVPLDAFNESLLGLLSDDILRADVIHAAVLRTVAAFAPATRARWADNLRAELAGLDGELGRLAEAIAVSGALPAFIEAVKGRQQRRQEVAAQLEAFDASVPTIDVEALRARIDAKLADWRAMLRRRVEWSRQMLRKLLAGPLTVTPLPEGRGFHYTGKVCYGKLLEAVCGGATNLASPTASVNLYRGLFPLAA